MIHAKPLLAALLAALALLCAPAARAGDDVHIGMLIYNGTDAFMADVFARILPMAEAEARVTFVDSKNSQVQQNEQVQTLLREGVDALIINMVDRTTAVYLIRLAQPYGVPIVFINREPLAEDLRLYEQAYYVGNNPMDAGWLCGDIVARYLAAHPEADRNGDGVLQYIMLKGEPGHQDTELRTLYAVRALRDAGIPLEKLAEDTAMWERTAAQETMSVYLASLGERVECVIANNDEMALGAIEALKAAGYFTPGRFLPVVGVDATRAALDAIAEGTLLGTVLNDPQGLSVAACQLALRLARGQPLDDGTFAYTITDERIIWTDSEQITQPF